VIDGVVYDSIGVRFKGNSSYTHPNNKKSFKLELDEFKSSVKWDGLKAVHLNNCWGDPTFMREKIHLDFCRDAGIVAPRASFARLSLNDTLWGFYSLIEHVDKRLLKTRFGNSDGDLFKAVDSFDPSGTGKSILADFAWYGRDDTSYYKHYELKTDDSKTAWPRLIGFIDTLQNIGDPAAKVPSILDFPGFCNAIAADELFGNLDSYINSGRNFYAYFPLDGKMEWIVWDVGLSFGAFQEGVPNPETMSVTYLRSETERPLLGRIFSSAALKHEYLLALCTLNQAYFTPARLFPHMDSIANLIRVYVNEDARKMYTIQQFERNISSDVTAAGGVGTRKPGLKSFVSTRQSSVKSQLQALGIDCATSADRFADATAGMLILGRNYPNPVRESALIPFSIDAARHVTMEIFDARGVRSATLVDGILPAGAHKAVIDASRLPAGIYLCRLRAGGTVASRAFAVFK
jgi:hypothetical protein